MEGAHRPARPWSLSGSVAIWSHANNLQSSTNSTINVFCILCAAGSLETGHQQPQFASRSFKAPQLVSSGGLAEGVPIPWACRIRTERNQTWSSTHLIECYTNSDWGRQSPHGVSYVRKIGELSHHKGRHRRLEQFDAWRGDAQHA